MRPWSRFSSFQRKKNTLFFGHRQLPQVIPRHREPEKKGVNELELPEK
jgi:hypothetical protein